MVLEGVKAYIKEARNRSDNEIMDGILKFDKEYFNWNSELYKVKNQSWREHENRNCPELEHCFWAMRLLQNASSLLKSCYTSIVNHLKAQPVALQEGMCEGQNWSDIINNGMVHKIFPAFLDTFGHEYEQNVFDPSFMVNMLVQAPQEKQEEFMARLNGTYQSNEPPINLDFNL